jgi:prepilin-type N-terminal cleavage/methylation domain-containing protein
LVPALRRALDSGLTLVEMMIAVALGVLLLGIIASLTWYTAQSFVALGNYDDLDRYSRTALDTMSRDIRQARSLVSYQTNRLVFQDYDGATNLTYAWNPGTRILARQKANITTVLLTNCDRLTFTISQRSPSNNFKFYPAINHITGTFDPTMCKLVDVSWTCSRQIRGQAVNTESIQTAKIVLRN